MSAAEYSTFMPDDRYWFRRWFGFSFLPIRWQGWAAIVAFFMIEWPILQLSMYVAAESLLWWLMAVTAFGLFLAFWAFVLSKTERR